MEKRKKAFYNIYKNLYEKNHSEPYEASLDIYEELFGRKSEIEEFASETDKCVSAKMRAMKGEDKPHDQKVAIAFSKCKRGE